MTITNVSAPDARARQQQGVTIVDVRSTREYAEGHAAGAVNVPLLEHDEDNDQLLPNPDFVRVMKANFAVTAPLIVSCQSGSRSLRAAQMLEAFGFQHISNVLGGFAGSRDGADAGWQASGLPVDKTPTLGGSYQDLLSKADQ